MSDFPIFMSNHMALTDYTTPGDFWMICLEVKGNPIGSFTDNLQMALHRASQHALLLIVMKGFP